MKTSLGSRDLVSIGDLSKEEIDEVFSLARKFQKQAPKDLLKGQILASCFFEPSTRTRLSFESAMLRLGGSAIGFADAQITSAKKGETLFDTIKVISAYADILILRHPQEGAARLAADASEKPLINAGDGANQHPTQTLLDLFTILECQGRLHDLHIVIGGDLKFSRTVHSLSLALASYPVRLYFVSSEALTLPDSTARELKKKGVKFSFHTSLEEVLPKADILYMTRVQKERISHDMPANSCHLTKAHLRAVKENLRILHPLPRTGEIEESIDASPHAYYFRQAANGLAVRMALLALFLGKS